MSAAGYDPVEAQGRDHNEIERLRARVAELEAALRELLDSSGEWARAREYERLVPLPGPQAHAVQLGVRVMKAADVARDLLEKR